MADVTTGLDAEGKPQSSSNDALGKSAPDILSQITDQGRNTRALLEGSDIESLIKNIEVQNSTQAQAALKKLYPGAEFPGNITKTSSDNVSEEVTNRGSASDSLQAEMKPESIMIGQQLWGLTVKLYNHVHLYQVSPVAIKRLEIEDSIITWPFQGSVVIDNASEHLERQLSKDGSYYHIRGDARDEIFIDITPGFNSALKDEIWKLTTHCVIYDVEDLPNTDVNTKSKKLYFWDKNYQLLQEKVIEWSTATGSRRSWFESSDPVPEPIAHATDEERSMYTGDAIASILIDCGLEHLVDKEKWDHGSSKVNFTAKANQTAQECIDYILEFHMAEGNYDKSYGLSWNRGNSMLNLLSFSRDFALAGKDSTPGELQIEHLFLGGVSEAVGDRTADNITSPWKAPFDETPSTEKDIKAGEWSTIETYRFSQMAGLDNAKAFVSRPVYSHYHKGKQFQVDVAENEISTVKAYFKKNYVEQLLGNDYPLMPLNLTKTEQHSIKPVFGLATTLDPTEDRISRGNVGRGDTLYASILLNNALVVTLMGSTHRLSGTFIGIDRVLQDSDNSYDYQLCGQYYVVSVRHIYSNSQLLNELVLVKVHAYDKLPNKEDVY
jgi:hypothetical protein